MLDTNIQLECTRLKKWFPFREGILIKKLNFIKAVDGIDLKIVKGETLGLAGESGCGKTTAGKLFLGLIKPTNGDVFFESQNINEMSKEEEKRFRSKAQIVFQNPFSSLNPRMTVRNIVGFPIKLHNLASDPEKIENKVIELLEKVRLEHEHIDRFPHEFSGGQRQRIAIARALSVNPKFIVLDEPTSSLDVSVQAHILNDLKYLQKDLGLTYLFITHDLSVISHMSTRVAIMYLGKIVELAKTDTIFRSAQHPYSHALLSAIPVPDPEVKTIRVILRGEVPSPINPPSGCYFHPRCHKASLKCSKKEPELVEISKNHYVSCYHPSSK